jgi:lipopolysaccharide/colanic/teichoic acid biosynthesis glycosyltransferase
MRHGADAEPHRRYVEALITGQAPAAADGSQLYKLTADDRVTRVGRFLRRTSLDELPQLWDVIRGRMSLVGPRPAIPYELQHYRTHWFARFEVKPGITGLWQVSGRSELTFEEMVQLDIKYVGLRSIWLDARILARTMLVLIHRRGAA